MTENNKPKVSSKRIWQAIGVLALIALGIFIYWAIFVRGVVYSDDARFNGHLVDLSPEVSGTLAHVYVHEGDLIKKDQKLFDLDPEILKSALDQAKASILTGQAAEETAQARYEKALHGSRPEEIVGANATVARLKNEEDLAALELEHVKNLEKTGVSTQDQLDRAKTTYESARQARSSAEQNLIMLRKGSRQEDIDAAAADLQTAKGRLAEAQAATDRAQVMLDKATLYAPFDGWVVRRWLDPGAMVSPGRPVLSLFDPSTLRVDANIEERYLNRVKIGDEVGIRVDAYPRLRLKGRVTEILRATNSEFSLVPSEGVSGTFIKVTQRVPLRISVNAPADIPLGPGLSVEVRIHVGAAAVPAAKK
jgi:membrane fusion protein (multidrug efflux system)